jgi:ubiquinone biosynthesis protein
MQALKALAGWLEQRLPLLKQLRPTQIVEDQLAVMLAELNMYMEARNQIQLRRNFADSPLLFVPRLYPQFTRDNLLVMDRIEAPSIGEIERLSEAGVDFKVLAHKGVETFFTQVFDDNFFHADMHPGNVFVDISEPSDPKWIALDCAIMGSLSESDQTYLAQNLIAFFARDYRQIVNLHLRSGWIPATTDAAAFEQVIRNVCEPIFAKAAERNTLCRLYDRVTRCRQNIRHAGTTTAGAAPKNPTLYRRPWPPALPRLGPMGNCRTIYAALGGKAFGRRSSYRQAVGKHAKTFG